MHFVDPKGLGGWWKVWHGIACIADKVSWFLFSLSGMLLLPTIALTLLHYPLITIGYFGTATSAVFCFGISIGRLGTRILKRYYGEDLVMLSAERTEEKLSATEWRSAAEVADAIHEDKMRETGCPSHYSKSVRAALNSTQEHILGELTLLVLAECAEESTKEGERIFRLSQSGRRWKDQDCPREEKGDLKTRGLLISPAAA